MERKSIGTLIAALRRANGMTQKDLAEKLNVSDKAVSRWERDESLPDLLLLPMIADIFGISVDELIRGEKKNTEKEAEGQETAGQQERLRKQMKRLTGAAISRLMGRMLIVASVGLAALLAAVICNFGFSRGVIGFFAGGVVWLAAGAMLCFFGADAWRRMDVEEYGEEEVKEYKREVVFWLKRGAFFLAGTAAFLLPLAACLGNGGYLDVFLEGAQWLYSGMICAAAISLAVCVAMYFINRRLLAAGLYPSERRSRRHGMLSACLTAVMAITLAAGGIVNSMNVLTVCHRYTFDDFDSFKAFMEESALEYMGLENNAVFYFDEEGREVHWNALEDEFFMDTVADKNGTVIGKVNTYGAASWGVSENNKGDMEFFAYKADEMPSARAYIEHVKRRVLTVFSLEPLCALLIWRLLEGKEKRRSGGI